MIGKSIAKITLILKCFFSLTQKVKYIVKIEKNIGIYCHANRGSYSYALGFGCDNDSMNYLYIYENEYYNDLDKLNIRTSKAHIQVSEVEIFQIIICDLEIMK